VTVARLAVCSAVFALLSPPARAAQPADSAAVAAAWEEYRTVAALSGRWQEVQEALPELDRVVARVSDLKLELAVTRLRARCALITVSVDEGLREYEKALVMAQRLGDETQELQIRVWIGRVLMSADRVGEALDTLTAVLERAARREEWGTWVEAMLVASQARLQRGENEAALLGFEAALAKVPLAPEQQRRHWEGEIRAMIANALGLSGRIEEAIPHAEEARRIQREIGAKGAELGTVISLAGLYQGLERYSMALEVMREGAALAEETGIREAEVILATQAGETYLKLGRADEALRCLTEVLPVAQSAGHPRHEAAVLMEIAFSKVELGDAPGAIAPLEAAWLLARDTEVRPRAVEILVALGKVHADLGALDRAEAYLVQARGVADSLRHPYLLAEAERSLGRVHAAKGRDDLAGESYARAVGTARSHGLLGVLREALVDGAEVSARAGDLAEADSALAEAIDLVESVREQLAGDETRLGFFTDKKEIYVRRASVLHELGDDEAAFAVAERARARVLLDVLSAGSAGPVLVADSTLRAREQRISAELARLQTELSRTVAQETWNAARADSLSAGIEEQAREYRAVLEEGGAAAGAAVPLSLAEVRDRVLGPDQILLEYLVGEEEAFAFVVGRDRFRTLRIAVGADSFRALVQAARQAVFAEPFAAEPLQALNSLLLAPLEPNVPDGARLVVVGDGPLLHFPFAALHDGTAFLVERHAVAQAPSASALDPALHSPRRGGRRTLLAVGNPSTYRAAALLDAARNARDWRFGELPFAGEEVRRVAARFRRAKVLIGGEAREESVKALAGGAAYLHFATHGLLDEDEPLLSGLALAQDEDPAEDGFLQSHEVMQLGLGADLVVLSACNSGLGRIAGGEGVLGLTRAFLQAGAGAVLLSLWEVADRSAAGLMDSFYRGLLDEALPADVALRRAQIEAAAAGAAPREWAPFVVTAGVEATDSRRLLPLGVAAAAVILVLVVASRTRRTRFREAPAHQAS
jgi:CHAT domain-containing protein